MKKCSYCGARNDAWEANCVKCKEPFVAGVDPKAAEATFTEPAGTGTRDRPTGEGLTLIGGIALTLGLLALGFGWFLPASEFSFQDIDPERLQLKANLMAVGAVVTNLGAMAYFAGRIVEALSYLPGRGEK